MGQQEPYEIQQGQMHFPSSRNADPLHQFRLELTGFTEKSLESPGRKEGKGILTLLEGVQPGA